MARLLNVKQMISAYRSASSVDEADALWNAFLTLRMHGFITDDQWERFFVLSYDYWVAEDSTMEV